MTGVTFKSKPSADRSHAGVSADWKFIQGSTVDPVVVVYKGFEFASELETTPNGQIRSFTQEMPCNYGVPLNETGSRPMPWRELMLELDTPSHVADYDWQCPHDLVDHECVLSPVSAFPLPRSLDEYLASLSKDNRYEFRRVNKLCAHLTVRLELPSRSQVMAMFERFLDRKAKQYNYRIVDKEDLQFICSCLELFIDRATALGTLFPLSIYDGSTLVAINIAELVNGRILDTLAAYDEPARDLNMGTFLINRNIEVAIAHRCNCYDLGGLAYRLVEEHALGSAPYQYKAKWMPKRAVTPYTYGYAVMSASQKPIPPYIDFTTKELRVAV